MAVNPPQERCRAHHCSSAVRRAKLPAVRRAKLPPSNLLRDRDTALHCSSAAPVAMGAVPPQRWRLGFRPAHFAQLGPELTLTVLAAALCQPPRPPRRLGMIVGWLPLGGQGPGMLLVATAGGHGTHHHLGIHRHLPSRRGRAGRGHPRRRLSQALERRRPWPAPWAVQVSRMEAAAAAAGVEA